MDILTGFPPYTFSIVIGLFFLINLLLGLYKGKGVKTFKDYAVADNDMGTGTLAITIIATIIGSEYVTAVVLEPQARGISGMVIAGLIFPLLVLLYAYFIFPTLLSYRDCYTLGDIMGKMYGKGAQIFTGLLSLGVSIIMIAIQILGVSHVAKKLGLNPYFVIFGLGITIIIYTWLGGIRSVAFTDILQFVCLVVGFLFLFYRVLQLTDQNGVVIGSIQRIFFIIKTDYSPTYLTVFGQKKFYSAVLGAIMLSFIFFSPPIINRVLVAKNTTQMRQSFYSFSLFYPLFLFVLTIVGFGLLIKNGKDSINPNIAFAKIAAHFFDRNGWAIVMLFVMLLAVVMSTADSFLSASVVVVIRDLIEPLSPKEKKVEAMKLIPYMATILGGVSIAMALFVQGQLIGSLSLFSIRILGILLIPIVLTAMQFKPHRKVFWGSILLFVLVMGALIYLGTYHYIRVEDLATWKSSLARRKTYVLILLPFALVITFLLSLGIHYIVYGKFTFEPKSPLKKKKNEESLFWQALKAPLTWASDKLSFEASAPVMVGMFLSLSWMIPELTTPQPHSSNLKVLLWVRIVGVLLCTGLLLHNRWEKPFKRYYPLFYYFALGYGFPFSYTLSFLYNPNNKINTMLLIFALIVLMILVNQRTFLFLTLVGSTFALLLAKLSPTQEMLTNDTAWHAGVSLVYTFIVSFFFIRFKNLAVKQRVENFKVWTLGYNHDMVPAHTALINYPFFLHKFIKKKAKKITKADKTYYQFEPISEQEYKDEIETPLAHLEKGGIMADALPKAFDQLIKHGGITRQQLKPSSVLNFMEKGLLFLPDGYKKQINIRVNKSQDFKATLHQSFFANIISNLVKNAVFHADAKNIEVGCNPKTREVYVKDDGIGIPSHAEPYIFNLYFSTGSTGVGLPFIKQLIEEMGGTIRFESSSLGTTFFIHFPENVAPQEEKKKPLVKREKP